MAELVRTLEITITRRLDGILHGDHRGLTPGHGTEPGEARQYQPGDDVRRIDWAATARTGETQVREQIADRDLGTWIVADASAAMRWGTTGAHKADLALAATAAIGFLTARNQNRIGAVIVAGPHLRTVPPRSGRLQVRAILAALAAAPMSEGEGPADLAGALDLVAAIERRRGFVTVVSDLAGEGWHDALARCGMRHDLLLASVSDPREIDVPPIGLVELVDPSTGVAREVRVTAAVQQRYRAAVEEDQSERVRALRRAGADLIELRTDGDWLAEIVRHVRRRRTQVAHGGVIGR